MKLTIDTVPHGATVLDLATNKPFPDKTPIPTSLPGQKEPRQYQIAMKGYQTEIVEIALDKEVVTFSEPLTRGSAGTPVVHDSSRRRGVGTRCAGDPARRDAGDQAAARRGQARHQAGAGLQRRPGDGQAAVHEESVRQRLVMAAVAEPEPRRARVNTYRTREGHDAPVELAYDVFGERGMPLVLVMGIGAQRIFWSEDLCDQFVAAGFQVVRFDHRDIGESTQLDLPTPKPLPLLARTLVGCRSTRRTRSPTWRTT